LDDAKASVQGRQVGPNPPGAQNPVRARIITALPGVKRTGRGNLYRRGPGY